MRYSIKPKGQICVKDYGFSFFAKNIGKNLIDKYSQKLLDSAKKSTTDPLNTASKRAFQKTEEATGDLIGNKIVDKMTKASSQNNLNRAEAEITKERYISPPKRLKFIDKLRLI